MFTDAATCDLPEPEYRALARWSASQIKLLPHRPELFHGLHVSRELEFDPTAGMLFGTACHAAFLEGKRGRTIPEEVLTSNGQRRGKAWDAYAAAAGPLDRLRRKELAALTGIRESIDSQPTMANLLFGSGPTEFGITAVHQETGLPVKSRIDKVRRTPGGRILCDLKITSVDPDDERRVSNHILAMGYHRQLAFYADMMEALFSEPPAAILVVIANPASRVARMKQFGEDEIELGRAENRRAFLDLARRLDSGDWHGEGHNRIRIIAYPPYAFEGHFTGEPLEEFAAYNGEN